MRTYRAWTDDKGGVVPDEDLDEYEFRLVDIETDDRRRILLRTIYRRRPFYFAIIPFFRASRGTTVFRIGRAI
jgi:hypothetical protein